MTELKCDNLINPVGIDRNRISFTYINDISIEYDYCVFVLLDNGGKEIWRCRRNRLETVEYDGESLEEKEKYTCTVSVFSENEVCLSSSVCFLTGFVPEKAKWIGFRKKTDRVIKFEKKFVLTEKIAKAVLCISGLGFFDATVNGSYVDDCFYKPPFTDYGKRNSADEPKLVIGKRQSVTLVYYDVTNLLKSGENLLEATVGNGYYQNDDRPEEPFKACYGDKRLLFELRIDYVDGNRETIFSDSKAKVRETNFKSGLYKGDSIDFTESDGEKYASVVLPPPSGEVTYKRCEFDRTEKELRPIAVSYSKGKVLYDFGINHSGGLYIRIKGRRGQKITVSHAETLYANGEPNLETGRWEEFAADGSGKLLNRIDQVSEYTLSGETDEIKPHFGWFCYRYAEIDGINESEIIEIKSLFIHTVIDKTGRLFSSEKLFEEIEEKTVLTVKDNLHCGILTDCPHREKRPYTGDGSVIAETMFYCFDAVAVYDKWLDDILNAQREDGYVPNTAPHLGGGGGYAWGTAIVTVPETLYNFTGNTYYLEKSFNGVCDWVSFLGGQAKDYIVYSSGEKWLLGDWLAPEMTEFDIVFMSTLVYYRCVKSCERFARILGDGEREKKYSKLAESIKDAINKRFFDTEKVCYSGGIQGENVLPFALDIIPEEYKSTMLGKIRERYSGGGCRIDTGIVATPILLEFLFENGMERQAYKMLTRSEYPSYAYMLDGETTLSEHWSKKWPDYRTGDNSAIVKGGGELSHCHPMFGSAVAKIYKYVAGLNLSKLFEKKILFTPRALDFLNSSEAEKLTAYGLMSIKWHTEGGLYMEVNIPKGFTGEFDFHWRSSSLICGEQRIENRNGRYLFELTSGKWIITE